jgi:predicted metal-dependent hydrolase
MAAIEYQLIRSRRRTIAILITPDASVVVRAPLRAPKSEIAAFVELKRRWIMEKRKLALERAEAHKPREIASGEEFPYLGRRLMLAATDNAERIEAVGGTLAVPRARLADAPAELKRWYVGEAARVVTERVNLWMERTGIYASALGITGARRRWGSCSTKGALNFTWRLIMAPEDVIDYVVVHELAHIEHPNHSRAFWARVAEIMPDYKLKLKWLRDNSALLKLF